MVPRLWKSLSLIHTSVKLVTLPSKATWKPLSILIHTSVKLVTVFQKSEAPAIYILIHTSVKLVTRCARHVHELGGERPLRTWQ